MCHRDSYLTVHGPPLRQGPGTTHGDPAPVDSDGRIESVVE